MTLCTALFLSLAARDRGDLEAAVAWMREAAAPLAGTELSDQRADLAPFGEMVGDARVVALGEEAHGSGSFLSLKHRLFEYLVSEKGFRVLVLEDSFEVVRALDEAVARGELASAFEDAQLAWHVRNAETREVLEWMELENRGRAPGERLRVFGMDVQNVSDAARGLEAVLSELDGGLSAAERETLVAFRDFSWHVGNLPEDSRARMTAALEGMAERLRVHADRAVERTSEEEWELARRRVRLLEQCQAHEEALARAPETSYGLRDGFLAENLLWILRQAGPDARAVVLAHNVHASRADYTASWEEAVTPARSMGGRLAEALGDGYVAFGTFGYRGALMPHAGGVVQRERAEPGSWNDAFFRAGHALFALDLRAAPATGAAARWLDAEHPQSWGRPAGSPIALRRHFDGVLFVERTTAPGALAEADAPASD